MAVHEHGILIHTSWREGYRMAALSFGLMLVTHPSRTVGWMRCDPLATA